MTPPEIIFYSETGGKSAPFYRTLGGIRSAFKTTWWARRGFDRPGGPPKVYAGTITWREVDLETGKPLIRLDGSEETLEHLVDWHGRSWAVLAKLTARALDLTHDRDHNNDLNHVHPQGEAL